MTVHGQVQEALHRGQLTRPDACENCASVGKVEAHHDDYEHPLDVRWLCLSCHRSWHAEHGPGANQRFVNVNFCAPPKLYDDFREVVLREDLTISQDLRRYMVKRVAASNVAVEDAA